MSAFTYLQATPADASAVSAGLSAFLLEFWGAQPPELLAQLHAQHQVYFPEALRQQQCVFWLAYQQEELAGSGGILISQRPATFRNPSGKHAYVFGMYTLPPFRKQGICRNILQRLEQSAKELGIGMLELHASPAGAPVYAAQGYQLHDEPTYRKTSW